LGGVDKKLLSLGHSSFKLTLVAKLIQGHKYICMFIYCIFACHLHSLSFNFPPSWLLNHKAFLVSAAENYHCHL
jgi:hypothetical protein